MKTFKVDLCVCWAWGKWEVRTFEQKAEFGFDAVRKATDKLMVSLKGAETYTSTDLKKDVAHIFVLAAKENSDGDISCDTQV